MSAAEDNESHGHRDVGNDVTFEKKSINNEVEQNSPMDMIGSGATGAGFNANSL